MADGVSAYLLSVLVRQQMLLKGHFEKRHPVSWLVWEPGPLQPAGRNPQALETQRPTSKGPFEPVAGDPLCFELALAPGRERLAVGRGPPNDIVINDATISREHLLLALKGSGWEGSTSPGSATFRNGVALTAGQAVLLADGDQLGLGSAQLTFHDPTGFASRLAAEAKKLKR